ncbi:hypothetical protein ACJRO7_034003 [Eucalyptus globulus]|uniref:WRKY domain-containing protein n=1 Tax=Eucalyptus globulus TaxID=34317 RepID=A0ABD3J286_EUCGL
MNGPQDPNPNNTRFEEMMDLSEFQLSDYLLLEGDFEGDFSAKTMANSEENSAGSSNGFAPPEASERRNSNIRCKRGKNKSGTGMRVAFRTKSELEVMDDGFKWRKYGKKSVKNSPNPRNYYKCSSRGCLVKKRVERDRDDSSYVMTTYEGVHNHESPSLVYYNYKQMGPVVDAVASGGWDPQAPPSHYSS